MKKYLIAAALIFSLESCYVKYPKRGQTDSFSKNQLQGIRQDSYTLLDNIQHTENSFRIRVLFLGFGGTKLNEEAYRREMAYSKAMQLNGIDGIVNPTFRTKYWKLPFIPFVPFGVSSYKTTVYGRGYKMR